MKTNKPRVSYFYDGDIGNFYYGQSHPMKPHRVKMTHNLLLNYGLYKYMTCYRPHLCTAQEMSKFHADEYVDFLKRITPDNMNEYSKQLHRFNVGEDCPVFDGLWDFCRISSGGSVGGAVKLNHGQSDIAINWAGGLHHAKKAEASGFCFINDIVLGILELLKYHSRVLYIDIDIHHGDGVEEAFYTTDRVMTASFHKYGDYFPGTGALSDIGSGPGRGYAVNFPLDDGIDDENFLRIFQPVMGKIMQVYNPGAVVLQCGADSLTGDRLGCFNLTIEHGHSKCVDFMKNFNVPLLVLGGGGYTIKNVARCWTYETGTLLEKNVDFDIPLNDYFEYFGPDYQINIPKSPMENQNSYEYLEKTKNKILQNLNEIKGAPSVQFQEVPPDTPIYDSDDEIDPDVRLNPSTLDAMVQHEAEYYEHDYDNDQGDGSFSVDAYDKEGGNQMEA